MSVAAFLTAALESALDNEVATPDDVLRHCTPDVLATHVPRAVWSRLLSTCLGAPRVDARLIIDTIGVATLCQHVPPPILWACVSEIATRALGRGLVASPPSAVIAASSPVVPVVPPVPPVPSAIAARVATPPRGTPLDASGRAMLHPPGGAGASASASAVAAGTPPKGTQDPAAEVTKVAHPPPELSKLAAEKSEMRGELTRVGTPPREPEPLGEPPAPPRAPGATTRAGAATQPPTGGRRPQAAAGTAAGSPTATGANAKAPRGTPPSARRVSTATDFEIETDVNEQWKRTGQPPPPGPGTAGGGSGAIDVPVDDDQLIDWSSSEETATSSDKYGKR